MPDGLSVAGKPPYPGSTGPNAKPQAKAPAHALPKRLPDQRSVRY